MCQWVEAAEFYRIPREVQFVPGGVIEVKSPSCRVPLVELDKVVLPCPLVVEEVEEDALCA